MPITCHRCGFESEYGEDAQATQLSGWLVYIGFATCGDCYDALMTERNAEFIKRVVKESKKLRKQLNSR